MCDITENENTRHTKIAKITTYGESETLSILEMNGHTIRIFYNQNINIHINHFCDDEDMMIAAVKYQPNIFRYASTRLKDNENVVKSCIASAGLRYEINIIFNFVSERLKDNKEFVLKLAESYNILEDVSDSLKDDEDVVFSCVASSHRLRIDNNFNLASERLKNNKEFVLKLAKFFSILKDVSETLKHDKDVVLACFKTYYHQFKDASTRLKNNKDFIMELITKQCGVYQYISMNLQNDIDVIRAALNCERPASKILELIGVRYYKKKMMKDILTAVSKCGNILKYADYQLKDNINVVLLAVKNNGWVINYASKSLQKNKIVFNSALESMVRKIKISGFDELVLYYDHADPYDPLNDPFSTTRLFRDIVSNGKFYAIQELGIFTYEYIHYHIKDVLKAYEPFYEFKYSTLITKSSVRKLLNHGCHHATMLFRRIADFLGVIHGHKINTYKNAFLRLPLHP